MADIDLYLEDVNKASVVRPHFRKHTKVKGYTRPRYVADMPSEELFELAKKSLHMGDKPQYDKYKAELTFRKFIKSKDAAERVLAHKGYGEFQAEKPGGERTAQGKKDKKVFNAIWGGDDSTSTDDKDSQSVAEPNTPNDSGDQGGGSQGGGATATARSLKLYVNKDLVKAIGTKTTESKDKAKAKKGAHKPPPKAKIGTSKKNTKNYQYDKKPKVKGKAPPKAGGKKTEENPLPAPVDPEKLAETLKIPFESLLNLAMNKTKEDFAHYFKAHGKALISKHKVPDDYWDEVWDACQSRAIQAEIGKARKSHLQVVRDTFEVHPRAYKKGTDERALAKALLKAGVDTLQRLAKFLSKQYDLDKGEAKEAAKELHESLIGDGALKEARAR